jgi:hypothetical protein
MPKTDDNDKPTRGRPPYTPTDKDRKQVKMLSGMGVPCADIAALIEISEPTMRKYYQTELDTGYVSANAQVAQSLFKQATDKDKPNVIAAIFWMKTRGGWRESQNVDAGKKEQKQEAANIVSKGKYGSIAPPLLVVKNGR